jgi:two-component system response regulator
MVAREVLWAEDNLEDQLLIRAALSDLRGAPRVEFADDGANLLDRLEEGAPDLVVLDLKMPRIGGLEALRRMRATPELARLPVSIFSAGDHPGETAACLELGALQVVQKPVDFRQFTEAVHRVVSLPVEGAHARGRARHD